jgi:di/tricarboxylate transporter
LSGSLREGLHCITGNLTFKFHPGKREVNVTPQIALVLLILTIVIALFVTEWIPMEVVSLLVLGSVALTGLVSPVEALSGFSNPAVVTVWAVFILSGGLTRTGVGNVIGRLVLVFAGRREMLIVVVIMLAAGVMSAFMNNVAVSALMLPVVMDVARHTNSPPSRLLIPLAYGALLGGLTTLIGTPPNILVSEALRDNGLVPFRLFDYTPVGVIVMLTGIAFMTLIGRYLLPKRDVARESSTAGLLNLREQYELQDRIFLQPWQAEVSWRSGWVQCWACMFWASSGESEPNWHRTHLQSCRWEIGLSWRVSPNR